jgi:hypothetical protein
MAAGSTYTPIATTTLGSNQNDITFSSISGSYTDLVLVITGNSTNTGSGSNGLRVRLNSDTNTNYSNTALEGNGTSAASGQSTSQTWMNTGEINQTSAAPSVTIIQFMNYSNSTTYKTVLNRSNTPGNFVTTGVGLWRSTSAINTILISRDFGTNQIKAGTTATLYGIAAA